MSGWGGEGLSLAEESYTVVSSDSDASVAPAAPAGTHHVRLFPISDERQGGALPLRQYCV
jgi:hypothetical protein